jgi:hypothetical protein
MTERRAIVAEFHKDSGGRLTLISVTSVEDHGDYFYRKIYDVDHSKSHGYLFHQSGAGGSGPVPVNGPYFVSGNVEVKEGPNRLVNRKARKRSRTRRLRAVPVAFDLEQGWDLLDWLEHNAIQQDAVWCSVCRDHLPGDDLCEHCWWCDATGWYSTPSDRCKCKDREACYGD